MPIVPFDQLPDDARLWVFNAARELTAPERDDLLSAVDGFLETWAAHGTPLFSGRELRDGRFLLVAVDERRAGASGCSIDALVHALTAIETRMNTQLLDNAPLHYRVDAAVRRVSRAQFQQLVDAGEVDLDTIVFDGAVATLGAVRQGRWEKPARASWHARAFFGVAPATSS